MDEAEGAMDAGADEAEGYGGSTIDLWSRRRARHLRCRRPRTSVLTKDGAV